MAMNVRGHSTRERGRLCGQAGAPHDRAALEASEFLLPEQVDSIKAYSVPGLVGVSIVAPDEDDLYGAIESMLLERVCDFGWHVQPRIEAPLRRYGLLHTSLAAPPDDGMGPMWLELAGTVLALGGVQVAPRSWFEIYPFDLHGPYDEPLPGPIEVRIDVATYANDRYPGVGVPPYV